MDPTTELLYVTEGVPNRDPRHGDGSSMISYEVLRHLPPHVRVTLLTFAGDLPVPDEIEQACAATVVLDLLPVGGRLRQVLALVLSPWSIAAWRRSSRTSVRTLARLSARADVTLLHGPHVAHLARHVRGPLVLQVIDPLSLVRQMDERLVVGWRHAYRWLKTRHARWAERRLPVGAVLLTVGERDAARWSAQLRRPVAAVPNGVEVRGRRTPTGVPTVTFVGSLSYAPNVESARVLVQEVAPTVWERWPATRFLIAGRRPDPAVRALAAPLVRVLADVAVMDDVFAESHVAAFPDRQGLGVRNSVSEALAAGVPVVATSVAAREQPAHRLLRVTDEPATFAELVVLALEGSFPYDVDAVARAPRSWQVVASEYLGHGSRAAGAGATDGP